MRRRDADALARLLDGEPVVVADPQLRGLAELARRIEHTPVVADSEFKECLRAKLLEQVPSRGWRSVFVRVKVAAECAIERWRYSLALAAAAGSAATLVAAAGVTGVAAQAPPGHPLYGMRLAVEDVAVAFARGDAARGERHLEQAAAHIRDAAHAAEVGHPAGAEQALHAAEEDLERAVALLLQAYADGDDSVLALLDEFTQRHRGEVAAIVDVLAPPADRAARVLLVRLDALTVRIAALSGEDVPRRQLVASPVPRRAERAAQPTESPSAPGSPATAPASAEPPQPRGGADRPGVRGGKDPGGEQRKRGNGARRARPKTPEASGEQRRAAATPGRSDQPPPQRRQEQPQEQPKPKPKPSPSRPPVVPPAPGPVDEVVNEVLDDVRPPEGGN